MGTRTEECSGNHSKLIYSRKDMNDKKELAITLIIWLMYFGDIQGFSPPSPGLNQMP